MPNTFSLIASSTVGAGGAASIDFTSISSTYTDLCVKVSARTDRASTNDGISMQFNSSGGTAYQTIRLFGSGSTPTVNAGLSTSSANIIPYGIAAALATASTFGSSEFYVSNYTGSTNKSVSVDSVGENNAADTLYGIAAGLWSNTAAITSIKLTPSFGTNFVQYSTAYLYGIIKS
jgi:hypothetical protein